MLFYVFLVGGILCILLGLLFLIKPTIIIRLNEIGNKVIFVDNALLIYPRVFGGFLLLASIYIIYSGIK